MEQENRYIDPSTNRKREIVDEKLRLLEGFPVFSIVEFNIFGSCNRNCSFCPVSNERVFKKINKGISIELYSKIMNDLNDIGFDGKILYSAFSEPMLHKNIYDLISVSKKKLPNSRVEIVTNGDILNSDRMKTLFDSGLDTINISLYDGLHQFEHFNAMMSDPEFPKKKVVLRRRYYEENNWGISISNRAGLIDSNKYRDKNEKKITELPLMKNCFYPFYQTLIDYNGDMIFCPHDWGKKIIVGNTEKEHIWKLWKSDKMQKPRKLLSDNDRRFSPCNLCDVKGDVMGRKSYDAWRKHINDKNDGY